MLKRFEYSYERHYGELEDNFHYDLYAKDRLQALLMVVADLKGIYTETQEEAVEKAKAWLDKQWGEGWTFEDCATDLELWPDSSTCYRYIQVWEAKPQQYRVVYYDERSIPHAYHLIGDIEGNSPQEALRPNLHHLTTKARDLLSLSLKGVSDENVRENLYLIRRDDLVSVRDVA